MAIVKRLGWVLVGVLIGVLASGSLRAAPEAQDPPKGRLVGPIGSSRVEQYNAYFIKDTATGACWLTVRSRDDQTGSLAPAPVASCQQ